MGNGSADYSIAESRYLVDLKVVAVGYTAPEVSWQRSFEAASKILFEATFGQMQFRKIVFVNNGAVDNESDIYLSPATIGPSSHPDLNQTTTFRGYINLMTSAKTEPLITVHELGHYISCLYDEYAGGNRSCTNDASTHTCIMEFGKGHSLLLDDDGLEVKSQPASIVNQFCNSDNHFVNGFPDINCQEQAHGQSCWPTLQRFYCELKSPADLPSPNSNLLDLDWESKILRNLFGFFIMGSYSVELTNTFKNTMKTWVSVMAGTDHMLLIGFGGFASGVETIQAVDNQVALQYYKEIDQITPGASNTFLSLLSSEDDGPSRIQLIESDPSSYKRLVLVLNGEMSLPVDELAELGKKQVRTVLVTLGDGQLTERAEKIAANNKWIEQIAFRGAFGERRQDLLTLQTFLSKLYFDESPGWGTVFAKTAYLPEDKAPEKSSEQSDDGDQPINLAVHPSGVDYPILVESGARTLFVGLNSGNNRELEFTLLSPGGESFTRDSESSDKWSVRKSEATETLTWLEIQSVDEGRLDAGRWLVRVNRSNDRKLIEFQVFACVENSLIGIDANVDVVPDSPTQFSCMTIHRYPLDYIDCSVEIFRIFDDGTEEPVRNLVLGRRKVDGVEFSIGRRMASATLDAGNYRSVFTSKHSGDAIYVTGSSIMFCGNLTQLGTKAIPVFSRVVEKRFRVL